VNKHRHIWRQSGVERSLARAQGWACTWCQRPLPEDLARTCIDHVIPVSRCGPNDEWNLDVLHARCNASKRDKITLRALEIASDHGVVIAGLNLTTTVAP
jgi:5-methylcytosine-specific restriction endonuclease McrA